MMHTYIHTIEPTFEPKGVPSAPVVAVAQPVGTPNYA